MKDLTTYFGECNMHECDGAATPASVMGMGNPMAPDGSTPGSGDTFDHQKRRKKVKPGKEKQEWPDDPETGSGGDKGQLKEGLLDDDFGITDDDFGLGFDQLLEKYAKLYRNHDRPSKNDYDHFFNNFKACVAEASASSGIKDSIMKACRGKNHVVVAFYKANAMGCKGRKFENVIEFRKFIKNPRPMAVGIGWLDNRIWRAEYHVNHPTNINIQMSEWFVLPGDVWDQLRKLID